MKILSAFVFALVCCISLGLTAPTLAMSDADKAVWGASEKVDTTFIVPSSQGTLIMGKAEGLISQWDNYDSGMTVMKLRTISDNLIETYDPDDIHCVGFNITRTTLAQGDQISISTSYYSGNLFTLGKDSKDAGKRAHLLSYILQVYSKSLTDAPAPAPDIAPTSAKNSPELPSDMEGYMAIIRTQLAAGKYDLALSSMEGLKSVIADKQKSLAAAPVSPAPAAASVVSPAAPAPVKSVPPPALPSDVLKNSDAPKS